MRSFASTHRLSLIGITVLALAAPACGDDDKDEGADAGTGETAETSESADGPETETSGSSMEGDGDGDGDGDGGDGDGDGGDGDGDGGDGDGDGDAGDGDGDGDPTSACVDHKTQVDCEADPACQPVMGQPVQLGGLGSGVCLLPAEFIGCIDMMGCLEAETWFCVGDDHEPYKVNNGCGPEGAQMCIPMFGDPPNCP
jgi:hypothetical protein